MQHRKTLLNAGPITAGCNGLFGVTLRLQFEVLTVSLASLGQSPCEPLAFLYFIFVSAATRVAEHIGRDRIDSFERVEDTGFISEERSDPEVDGPVCREIAEHQRPASAIFA